MVSRRAWLTGLGFSPLTQRPIRKISRPRERRLAVWYQAAGPDGFGGQHTEQVEVGRLFIVEETNLMPGAGDGIEHLVAVLGLQQAHGTIDLRADGVGGGRYRRQIREFGEDPLRGQLPRRGAPTPGRGRRRRRGRGSGGGQFLGRPVLCRRLMTGG